MTRLITIIVFSLLQYNSVLAQEPVVGGPCQGCELVFVGMPTHIRADSVIGSKAEVGESLILSGTVSNADGSPASNIIVYAYQTDASGKYPQGATKHGNLRGWAKTDDNGLYQFATIRPGAYPARDEPQHIHLHIIEPQKSTYYIDDVTFSDDPLLTTEHRQTQNCRGGCGESQPEKNQQGVWLVRRDIILGRNIPDYK